MAKRGRTPGFKMPEEHRSKIKTTQLLNRLQSCGLGEAVMTSEQIRAAEICLRKALPDLSAQEITGDVHSFVMRLPEPAVDTATWERTNSMRQERDTDTKH
jgi:hypothetical protein